MLEALQLPFMQRALLGGILVAILASYYGVFVVQRGLAFLGAGLAHAAFGGVALGLLLDVEPLWVAVPFTVLAALGIVWVRERTELAPDTAIGIFFAVSMALGIIFLAFRHDFSSDAFTYLFGSILAVSSADLWVMGLVLLATLATRTLWGQWAYATFDRELAQADRIPTVRHDYLLAVLLAVTIVVSMKVVGIVLIAAFLVIPAATARLLARTFARMTVISVLVGVLSAVAGLWTSYVLDLPSGAAIILVQAVLFFVALVMQR